MCIYIWKTWNNSTIHRSFPRETYLKPAAMAPKKRPAAEESVNPRVGYSRHSDNKIRPTGINCNGIATYVYIYIYMNIYIYISYLVHFFFAYSM